MLQGLASACMYQPMFPCLLELAGPPIGEKSRYLNPFAYTSSKMITQTALAAAARPGACSIPGVPNSAEETTPPPAGQTVDMPFDSMSSGDEDGTSSYGVRSIGSSGSFDASLLRSAEELRDRRSRLVGALRNHVTGNNASFDASWLRSAEELRG